METSAIQDVLSLPAIRDRASIVYGLAVEGRLSSFDFNEAALNKTADIVAGIIQRDFGPDRFASIAPHGRWQHFEVGNEPRISVLLDEWKASGVDEAECTRRLIDLFFVSVLLDAGAGNSWAFTEPNSGMRLDRSEGLAVASLHMYKQGNFGTQTVNGMKSVDGQGLRNLTHAVLEKGMQASTQNPLTGLESRLEILQSLGDSLLSLEDIFGPQGRPGNLVDYLHTKSGNSTVLAVTDLWAVLQKLLIPIWPQDRTRVFGKPVGDAWPLNSLKHSPVAQRIPESIRHIQPFHKLTQWLAYSLTVPFERVLGYTWKEQELLTGLPEYRNGGLFVDTGVLTLKHAALDRGRQLSAEELPMFEVFDDVIVEWRALTVILLDIIHKMVNEKMSETGVLTPGTSLSMAQVLEAGTWKAGRELAAEKRPTTRSSPILVKSDGTVF